MRFAVTLVLLLGLAAAGYSWVKGFETVAIVARGLARVFPIRAADKRLAESQHQYEQFKPKIEKLKTDRAGQTDALSSASAHLLNAQQQVTSCMPDVSARVVPQLREVQGSLSPLRTTVEELDELRAALSELIERTDPIRAPLYDLSPWNLRQSLQRLVRLIGNLREGKAVLRLIAEYEQLDNSRESLSSDLGLLRLWAFVNRTRGKSAGEEQLQKRLNDVEARLRSKSAELRSAAAQLLAVLDQRRPRLIVRITPLEQRWKELWRQIRACVSIIQHVGDTARRVEELSARLEGTDRELAEASRSADTLLQLIQVHLLPELREARYAVAVAVGHFGSSLWLYVLYYSLGVAGFALAFLGLQIERPGSFSGVSVRPWSRLVDFLYLSVTTMTTVGAGNVVPTSAASKLLVVFEIATGILYLVGVFGMGVAAATAALYS